MFQGELLKTKDLAQKLKKDNEDYQVIITNCSSSKFVELFHWLETISIDEKRTRTKDQCFSSTRTRCKKTSSFFFSYSIIISIDFFSNHRWPLGNKCIENGWQRWKHESIVFNLPMKNFKWDVIFLILFIISIEWFVCRHGWRKKRMEMKNLVRNDNSFSLFLL